MALKTRTVVIALSVLFAVATVAVAAVVTAGAKRPVDHTFTVSATVAAPCDAAWAAVADLKGQAAWRAELAEVRALPDRLGRTAWMEFYSHGERMIVSEVALEPPSRVVWRLDDDTGPFEARWEFTFGEADGAGGCEVSLLEEGRSRNPMFRFVLHYLVGEEAYARLYLSELSAHLADPERG